MRPALLVVLAGTGTEVGKTWVGRRLLEELRRNGSSVAARKPAQSYEPGDPLTDADELAAGSGEDPLVVCPPHRRYEIALAPPMAADLLGRPRIRLVDLVAEMAESWPSDAAPSGAGSSGAEPSAAGSRDAEPSGARPSDAEPTGAGPRADSVAEAEPSAAPAGRQGRNRSAAGVSLDVGLVELVGGVRSPIAHDGDGVDLIAALRPDLVVVVADAGLGTINAVRTTLDSLAGVGAPIVVHLNRFDPSAELHARNRAWFADLWQGRKGAPTVTVDVADLADLVELAGATVDRSPDVPPTPPPL